MVTIIIVVVVAAFAIAGLAAGYAYYMRRHKRDDSWQISLDELQFPEPCVVLGSGTYGQVRNHFHEAPLKLHNRRIKASRPKCKLLVRECSIAYTHAKWFS